MAWRDKAVPSSLRFEIELTDKGISFTGESGDALWKWNSILKALKYKKLFMFEFKDKGLFYIPFNGFPSSREVTEFSKQLDDWIKSQQVAAPNRDSAALHPGS